MSFSQADLAALADDFASVADAQIRTPRAYERRNPGAQSGFSHFSRAVERQPVFQVRTCRRCKQPVRIGVLCERHREIHRREAGARARKLGCQPWQEGGKGRPPDLARLSASSDVAVAEMLLTDALIEQAAANKRVAQLRKALTEARKSALRRIRERASQVQA